MQEQKIIVVIGAGYGDEGKGLVTNYSATHSANLSSESVAVVRFSGGANAGHTVDYPDGTRHVFQHIGSATKEGVDTILTRDFVVNPVLFWKEVISITENHNIKIPKITIDPDALVTTPMDVYINQRAENARGDVRHGSTGVGLGETVERAERGYALRWRDILNYSTEQLRDILDTIETIYLPERLNELGVEHGDTYFLDEAIEKFMVDAAEMAECTIMKKDTDAFEDYTTLVFEGSQGLMLDQNSSDFPHVTRANTGTTNIAKYFNGKDVAITVIYVTRTFLTRHGEGSFPTELDNFDVVDLTNQPNEFQGAMRYASLDYKMLSNAIKNDMGNLDGFETKSLIALTWCDREDVDVPYIMQSIRNVIDVPCIFKFNGKTRNDIEVKRFINLL